MLLYGPLKRIPSICRTPGKFVVPKTKQLQHLCVLQTRSYSKVPAERQCIGIYYKEKNILCRTCEIDSRNVYKRSSHFFGRQVYGPAKYFNKSSTLFKNSISKTSSVIFTDVITSSIVVRGYATKSVLPSDSRNKPTRSGKHNTGKELPAEKKHLQSRPRTKNPSRLAKTDLQDVFVCTAFSTAKQYNLEHLSFDLQAHQLCRLSQMPQDVQDVLHMNIGDSENEETDNEPGEIFFFREGSVVLWNVSDLKMKKVMRILSKHEINSYEVALVNWENEQMAYRYSEQATKLSKGDIILNSVSSKDLTVLEKFTFANALALSVKLAIWEYSLDRFVSSIEWVPEYLKAGKQLKMSREDVMKKVGELMHLRHLINLSSDLLMTPDFYWDREELEHIFNTMCNYLNIARRTKVMNEKLNHCSEMVELMRTHLNEKHSLRLEWMIILLIAVEVVFEIIHSTERYMKSWKKPKDTVTRKRCNSID
ncbi:required for meiotic nuclear division protein 1 homolog [Saccoglossus kowalevskii]|uniref:Required for meiotic nuclear division protein 1 homolog n=1 Tax=Saccoglossus kowalevskii TaxID=10224 RepID=A0ABM0GP25_SACKO|nr:PREDICTED: required for meiotic nuclear division protein 1 homolog [Saccoglossus kowalevskii]